MSDYIDKQAAIDVLKGLPTWYGDAGCLPFGDPQPPMEALLYPEDAISAIENLPSADVEPIVRCKDCHFFEQDHWETVNGVPLIVAHNICTRWGGGCQTEEDGFCFMAIRSQGAREDGEQDDRA